jgi:tetratricopeptide (TPR) repeat protein
MRKMFHSRVTKCFSAILVICIAALHVPVAAITPQKGAAEELKQIQYKYYFRGRYDEAIDALQTFLTRSDVPKSVEVSAREFLAASYILSGNTDKGKDQFLRLLNEDESYAGPDPTTFKAEVVEAFTTTRDALASVKLRTAPDTGGGEVASGATTGEQSKPVYKKWWFYVGLAAALVVLAAATSQQGEEPETPPAPTGTVTVGVQVR